MLKIQEKGSFLTSKEYPGKAKLIVSPNLRREVAFLHSKIAPEWCGVLGFNILEGTLESPNDLVLEAKAIYPMDIGSSAYTSSEDNLLLELDDFNTFQDEFEMGLIHSHHNMGVFFSGTDSQELKNNCDKHSPFYLSLIVNKKGEYCAKISWIEDEIVEAHTINRNFYAKGKVQATSIVIPASTKKTYFTLDLEVFDKYDSDEVNLMGDSILAKNGKVLFLTKELDNDQFIARYEELKKDADNRTKAAAAKAATVFKGTYKGSQAHLTNKQKNYNDFKGHNGYNAYKESKQGDLFAQQTVKVPSIDPNIILEGDNFTFRLSSVAKFITRVLSNNTHAVIDVKDFINNILPGLNEKVTLKVDENTITTAFEKSINTEKVSYADCITDLIEVSYDYLSTIIESISSMDSDVYLFLTGSADTLITFDINQYLNIVEHDI